MSLTEQIIEIIEQELKIGVSDDELDRILFSTGCRRVVHFADTLIVYYVDAGQERFIVLGPPLFRL